VILHFAIKDSGIGMTDVEQEKLFTTFSQADSSTTRKYGGTGLGLAISKNLTQLMGGKIWVESQKDMGSTFHFSIQLKKYSVPDNYESLDDLQGNNVDSAIDHLRGKRILLVEDNELNQELTSELLNMNDISVEIANNGKEALEKIEAHEFDGVLMDCQMPVMDGYEATTLIRKQEKYKSLPILALTANAMKQDIERVKLVGMNDHISKPINPDVMFQTMAKWINPV